MTASGATSDLDYLEMLKFSRAIKTNASGFPKVKLAVLGDSSTQQLSSLLKASLYRRGLFVDIYESPFNVIDQEIFDDKSEFHRFRPDYVLLYVSTQNFRDRFYQEKLEGRRLAESVLERTQQWWNRLSSVKCRILQTL